MYVVNHVFGTNCEKRGNKMFEDRHKSKDTYPSLLSTTVTFFVFFHKSGTSRSRRERSEGMDGVAIENLPVPFILTTFFDLVALASRTGAELSEWLTPFFLQISAMLSEPFSVLSSLSIELLSSVHPTAAILYTNLPWRHWNVCGFPEILFLTARGGFLSIWQMWNDKTIRRTNICFLFV